MDQINYIRGRGEGLNLIIDIVFICLVDCGKSKQVKDMIDPNARA